jgi:hypothetical protein
MNQAKKKVFVTVPCVGWLRREIKEVFMHLLTDERVFCTFMDPVHKPVENNMMHCVKHFMAGDADFWLSMDSDNPPFKNPLDLVFLNKDIVGCPTPIWKWEDSEETNYRPIQWNAFRYKPETDNYTEHQPKKGLQKVDAIGSGCFVVARRVFENPVMRTTGWHRKWCPEQGTVYKGLDISFCERAREQGFEVYAHFDYPCDHFCEMSLVEISKAFNAWHLAVKEADTKEPVSAL